jgi:hypothetical protein
LSRTIRSRKPQSQIERVVSNDKRTPVPFLAAESMTFTPFFDRVNPEAHKRHLGGRSGAEEAPAQAIRAGTGTESGLRWKRKPERALRLLVKDIQVHDCRRIIRRQFANYLVRWAVLGSNQ